MKRLIIILLAMLPMLFVAKAETIKVDSVGKLATVLPDSVRFTIADLSVSGPLNGADLKLLQQIVTRNKTNKSNPKECLVTSIDLSGATIQEGKDGLKTKAGELPSGESQRQTRRRALPGHRHPHHRQVVFREL